MGRLPKFAENMFILVDLIQKYVTLWDQFISFLVNLVTFNNLVSLFMTIINILCVNDKMQNILLYFSGVLKRVLKT